MLKNTKGFSTILTGVLIAFLITGGFVMYKLGQNSSQVDYDANWPPQGVEVNDGLDVSQSEGSVEEGDQVQISPDLVYGVIETEIASVWHIDTNPGEGRPPEIDFERVSQNEYQIRVYVSALDDSVSTMRYTGIATFENGDWVLSSPPTRDWKCHPGRGHQDYSTENCI